MKSLKNKTIKSVKLKGHDPRCDSKNILVLEMTDGSLFEIEGGYGGYTGKSCDEYIETIKVNQLK